MLLKAILAVTKLLTDSKLRELEIEGIILYATVVESIEKNLNFHTFARPLLLISSR